MPVSQNCCVSLRQRRRHIDHGCEWWLWGVVRVLYRPLSLVTGPIDVDKLENLEYAYLAFFVCFRV